MITYKLIISNRRKKSMTLVRDILSVKKDVRVISFASCFHLVSMYSKEMPGTDVAFPKKGMAMYDPVPGASFSSKMKLLRK